ncbi:MAG TPA: TRAP transporter fused permease subunit, partial [Vicinamibacterales bacterium]|nr:TRAP transporter fused permease subunit [Vicinamibacterales bacterium]
MVVDLAEVPDEFSGRRLDGLARWIARILAIGLSLYSLYWVLFIVQPQIYRVSFLLIALVLIFMLVPRRRGLAARVEPLDWLLIVMAIAALSWPMVDFGRFVYRAADPLPVDVAMGAVALLLVLEATRRSVGWILPATAIGFIVYGYAGPAFDRIGLPLIAHRGYELDRLVGTLYMTLEGVFGVPLDVASTYIILFTIYGAVLEYSGAGRFFIDWSMAAMGRSRSGAGPGRTVTVAGFLLGTVSGSGVATTVMLGSVAWPMLRGAGYRPEVAGAMLSAAGIGALISPPTLGAAAFLIAEFLKISYLQVLVMATIPTALYYLSIMLMIEADARRLGARPATVRVAPATELFRSYWYHFSSLVAIGVFMVIGMSAFRAVFWATVLAIALSFVRRDTALTPARLAAALESGATGVLGVCATTATAGIIVGIVTLTGLGLKISGLIVAMAGGQLFLTVVYSAIAVWMLGLAVPVTASYIIAAVMVAPALVQAGVSDTAAHMFIFYYAVLSEVSPPTALSPFAAAALTGGNPFETMMLTWKYTLPAFLVPFVFTLTPSGQGILLAGPIVDIALTTLTAALGVACLAGAFGGWIRGPASRS